MTKNSNGSKGIKFKGKKRRPCLMAYTLNNTQPVICTLLADQPYFYMEEENAHEEDILGLDIYADFEAELLEIKNKIESLDRISKYYERDPQRRIEEFAAQSIDLCESANLESFRNHNHIENIIACLSSSRMAKNLYDYAHNNKVKIIESHQEQSAIYNAFENTILINPDLGLAQSVLLMVRELRRHWQHKHGVMIHPLTFHPDHAILINRAQLADLNIAMIRTGWELQLAGQRDVWDYIENSHLVDLGRAFAKEAFADFRSMNSGKAAMAVFEQWFLSERCRHQDKKLIQQMLADHAGYVFQDITASRMISIDLITALGAQPFGNNYLSSSARMIIEDPMFTEVRDRSNANFLWFVKFERSCRESEQALQSEKGLFGEHISAFSFSSSSGTSNNDQKPSVLQFMPSKSGSDDKSSNQDGTANVIHVLFGKG